MTAVRELKTGSCRVCGLTTNRGTFCPIDDGLLDRSGMDHFLGRTVGGALVTALVADGMESRVYRAERPDGTFVAVKVLRGGDAAHPRVRSRFEREGAYLSKLKHVNLVMAHDFGLTEENLPYIVMDWAQGDDLAKVLKSRRFDLESAIELIRSIASGLAYAHSQGIIHRDFKPANVVILAADGTPKIVDFGFASDETGHTGLTEVDTVVGTPSHMAPEQAAHGTIDHRTDLFAFGVVAYELIAGVHPFDGSPLELLQQNMMCEPPPFAERVPGLDVPKWLEKLVFDLMEKEPNDRCSSAQEVCDRVARGDTPQKAETAIGVFRRIFS